MPRGVFEARLAPGVEVLDRGDGSWVAVSPGRTRAVVLEPVEAALAEQLDGRPLEEVAAELVGLVGRIPFGRLLDVVRRLAAAGLLAEPEEARRGAGGGRPRLPARLAALAARTLKVLRLARPRAPAAAWRAAARPWLGACVAVGALAAAVLTRPWPPLPRLAAAGEDPLRGLALLYAATAAALAVRGALRAAAARGAGRGLGPWRLRLVCGVLTVDPGSAALVAAPARVRLGGAALAGGAVLAIAVALARGAAALVAVGSARWGEVDVAGLGALLVAVGDLCPVGATLGAELMAALHGPAGSARALADTRRRLRGIALGPPTPREVRLAASAAWVAAWAVGATALVAAGASRNALPLASALADRAPWRAVALALLLAGPAVVVLGAAGMAVAALLAWIRAAVVARRPRPGVRCDDPRDRAQLVAFLRDIPLLSRTAYPLLEAIAAGASRVAFRPGEPIVRQGEPGDTFYIVLEGQLEVVVEDAAGLRWIVAALGPSDCFGEVALLEDVPRTATVRARTAGAALVVRRELFQQVVAGSGGADLIALIRGAAVLRSAPLFADLAPEAMGHLLAAVQRVPVQAGQRVVRRGEEGDRFFVVLEGELEVLSEDERTRVARLHPGDAFGEIALLAQRRRTATVRALRDGTLLALDREGFFAFFRRHLLLGERLEHLASQRRDSAAFV